ncbi:unnamed protein product [Amaranthus hypochondriacus]
MKNLGVFVVMLAFVILVTQSKITWASDPYPLANIMIRGIGMDSLQCVGYGQACGPAYWCCGTCYCDYVFAARRFQCTTPAYLDTCG